MPCDLTASISSATRTTLSISEYSVCSRRWTKAGFILEFRFGRDAPHGSASVSQLRSGLKLRRWIGHGPRCTSACRCCGVQ